MRTLKTLIVNNQLLFTTLLAILFYSCGTSQEIEGTWQWSYQDEKHTTEIILTKKDTSSYWLTYCSSFSYGNKLDCYDDGTKILITKLSNNLYEGVFKSYFSNATGKIKITIISNDDLKIELLEEPNDEYYFPRVANFTRI